ncbi:MAG TPA: hypothetical protein VFJ53_05270 [Solirubrobacterales bacterium]|nr:hypothetical protein [Solirubrobacterales bacterium]
MKIWIKLATVVAACALIAPAGAGAATITNGDFETGNLDGWQVYNSSPSGNWFAYSGTSTPYQEGLEIEMGEPVTFFPPPQGSYAAVTDEYNPDTAILYQDVALEPSWTHHLALTLYYKSYAPITVPEPNTLATDDTFENNQQLRVDVMKPTAPIESLASGDILATVFANKNGDPMEMAPATFTADLTPFAGQTVRLRVANAVQDNVFNTGVDAVSISSTPPPAPAPPAPSNAISRGKLTLNKKKGTGKLAIVVPGPGTLTEVGKGKKKKVKGAALTVTAAGTVQVPLKPTTLGRKILNAKGKLKSGIEVTFAPTGGTAAAQIYKVTLKKTLKP